ncbi:MAG TPA: hypothetical protein VIW23_01570 [Candidatus Acidoferrum sp.]|jgi:hypothetical protein
MEITPISIQEARDKGIPLPTLLKASIAAANEKNVEKKRLKPKRPAKPRTYSLADAFDYFDIPTEDESLDLSPLNNERCVRAVALLLHSCSQGGNESVLGLVAHGLGHVLENCAAKIAQIEAHRRWCAEQEAGRG